MFKMNAGLLPLTIKNLFQTCENIHTYNTRNKCNLYKNKGNHEFIYSTFVYQGTTLESYPTKYKYQSLHVFKKNLKHFLKNTGLNFKYTH